MNQALKNNPLHHICLSEGQLTINGECFFINNGRNTSLKDIHSLKGVDVICSQNVDSAWCQVHTITEQGKVNYDQKKIGGANRQNFAHSKTKTLTKGPSLID